MRATEDLRSQLISIVGKMGFSWPEKTVIEPPKDPSHGDLSTNLALLLTKEAHKPPREIAEQIAGLLQEAEGAIESVEAAGPGFLNVVFTPAYWQQVVSEVEEQGASFGRSDFGANRRVLVEFVSANPTGPLHVGHGRGAAVGDSLARLLRVAGFDVDTEYYINDAGRQMRLLGLSVWLRARELAGLPVTFPEEFYRGDYIRDIAGEMLTLDPELVQRPEAEGLDRCYSYAMKTILEGIKTDLNNFRVKQDRFFSEKSLVDEHAVERAFAALDASGLTFEQEGAYWFATSRHGDDKDRVLKKSDGSLTYFASDIAYHHNKYERGYDWLIDVWGADHHGYVPRMRAAIAAMGREQSSFDVVLIQLVNLMKDGQPLSMSTRAGTFETLADVVREVGVDASRFMFLSRKSDSPLDFDLDLVRQRNLENPVYYVQYAHARISAIHRRALDRGWELLPRAPKDVLGRLVHPDDMGLLRKMAAYTDCVRDAARTLGVHHVSRYLTELAGLVHSYYTRQQILAASSQEDGLARLYLLKAVAQVLKNGLDVLGVEAPEQM